MPRLPLLKLVVLGASMLAATAAFGDALLAGWISRADGALVHEASGAICPLELSGFKRIEIEAKGAPDLGVCAYAGEREREGLIRVRQYLPGTGETALAIQNDKTLIERPPGRNAMTLRTGPGPNKNGAPTQQIVITLARNGLLIDCLSRQLKSDEGKEAKDFALACMSLQEK